MASSISKKYSCNSVGSRKHFRKKYLQYVVCLLLYTYKQQDLLLRIGCSYHVAFLMYNGLVREGFELVNVNGICGEQLDQKSVSTAVSVTAKMPGLRVCLFTSVDPRSDCQRVSPLDLAPSYRYYPATFRR